MIDGEPLSENVAIQQWIHRNYPAAKLLPADPMKELKAISLMSWCASGIHPFLALINNPARVCDLPGTEDAVKRLSAGLVYENFTIADDSARRARLVLRPLHRRDAHFFWCFRRGAQLKLDLAPFKNCNAHFERMQERPSVQKLLAFEKETQEAFAKAA